MGEKTSDGLWMLAANARTIKEAQELRAYASAWKKEIEAWKLAAYHDDWSGLTTLAAEEKKT